MKNDINNRFITSILGEKKVIEIFKPQSSRDTNQGTGTWMEGVVIGGFHKVPIQGTWWSVIQKNLIRI